MKPEQARVKDLITDTVLLLCKNGLSFSEELKIEGVIGITLDDKDLFLVHVNERLPHDQEIVNDKSLMGEVSMKENEPQIQDQYNSSMNSTSDETAPSLTQSSDPCYFEAEGTCGEGTSSSVVKIEDTDRPCREASNNQNLTTFPSPRHTLQKRLYHHPYHRPQTTTQRQTAPLDNMQVGLCSPDAKQFNQEPSTSRLGLPNNSLDNEGWSQLGEFASQAAMAAAVAIEMPTDGRLQAPPACSSWTPTASRSTTSDSAGGSEAKYPSHALQSHNIKEAFAFTLVDPLLEASPGAKIMSFRLSWFGSDSAHLDKVWQNIVTLQEQMDQFIGSAAGAKIFVSAYTGTLSGRTTKTDTPGLRMSYPGLAYWVFSEREQLDERFFMRQLHEQAFGARIKSLLYEYEQNKDKITNALFVVAKDCTGGFVRRKVDESVSFCAERGRSKEQPALVRLWVKDETCWDQMQAAYTRLKSACCDVSLHRL